MVDMFHETPKRFIEQSFKAGYTVHDQTRYNFQVLWNKVSS